MSAGEITSGPTADEQARFLKNLQLVLAEGDFVSTYKFGLLLSLVRWAVEHPLHDPARSVSASALTPYFVELYWPHVAPFRFEASRIDRGAAEPEVRWPGWSDTLVQDSGKQIPRVLSLIRETRSSALHAMREIPRVEMDRLHREATKTLVEQPLWKLQRVRTRDEPICFLYRQGTTRRDLVFERGAIDCLVSLASLIEDLVRSAWLRFVIRHNSRLLRESAQLEEFLFPDGRASLDVWRPVLRDFQGDECFYCGRSMQNRGVVDHFLPWSRYPRDLGQNFVLAHADCNGGKSDHLAAAAHLEAWCGRNSDPGIDIAGRFAASGLPQHWPTVWGAARSLYSSAADGGASAWNGKKDFALIDAQCVRILDDHSPAA